MRTSGMRGVRCATVEKKSSHLCAWRVHLSRQEAASLVLRVFIFPRDFISVMKFVKANRREIRASGKRLSQSFRGVRIRASGWKRLDINQFMSVDVLKRHSF